MERDTNGNFTHKGYGEKKTRAIRISDEGWDKLQALAESQNCSRADLIENFARDNNHQQKAVTEVLEVFINIKESSWGSNPSQKGNFNPNSRTWDIFNQFKKFLEQNHRS